MNVANPIVRPSRSDLPFRDGVGMVLFNDRGQVWAGARQPRWAAPGEPAIWQMPQGGIKGNEVPVLAALRELREETGAFSFEPVAVLDRWLSYEVPDHLLGIALKAHYRGQRQLWFAVRFTGDDREFDLNGGDAGVAEFSQWAWLEPDEIRARVVPWKRQIYSVVLDAFDAVMRADRK